MKEGKRKMPYDLRDLIEDLKKQIGKLGLWQKPLCSATDNRRPRCGSEDLLMVIGDRTFKAHFGRNYFISGRADKSLGLTENHDFETGLTSTLYIDATWRLDRAPETIPRRVTFKTCFPDEIQEKVIKIWNEELKLTPKA